MAVVNAYKIEIGKVVQVEQKLTPGAFGASNAQHAESWARSRLGRDILG
jgi:hypothetical protein